MSKSKAEKLSDKEKEQQRLVIPFDKAKKIVTNLNALFDSSELFGEWEIKPSSIVLKSTSLKMQFTLKSTAIERELENMDKGQKKIKDFTDPDEDDEDFNE
ncbi:hypothetical protein LCGC14_2230350 [marine sediment metagenome]|uniref:Uncharacterized protein n=1 Tax=marine sediment metagenome TaxID=412755 RepID=A0A0F9D8N8_9ZZZZ